MLVSLGLSDNQATVYLYLVMSGETPPPKLAEALRLTRSNAYKILDSLVDLNLLHRQEINKKLVYTAVEPSGVLAILERERGRLQLLEQQVAQSYAALQSLYDKKRSPDIVKTYKGEQALKAMQTTAGTVDWHIIDHAAYGHNTQWMAKDDSVVIADIGDKPVVIKISNPEIAASFITICRLIGKQ